ncbi:hypothetical protein DVH24_026621 [Malus domestica]|uniref:Sugar phosphate transporter domain-containing protein n=1 Tax=Malus domestica TaxID=3750 RepID=A0A498K3I9_MALDO|nr:hypothetical protein DVH24_026621 [Malus domestica]
MSAAIQWTTVGMVAAWYGSNIGVLLLNKYLLTNYGFRFPIFLTLCHMTACSVLSYVAIAVMKVAPLQSVKSKVQFAKIAGLSVFFCFSVVCGNVSLKYLPVSFNQAVGATTPFFTAVFSFLIIKKREASLTYAALMPVVAGVIVASGGEPSFHLFGFVMCITATAARAFKSVLQEILLSSDGEKLNSMNLLLYMAPMAVAFLLPATLLMEENVVGITIELARKDIKLIWYLFFNSSLAYFVNLTNFLVTKHTSALTLQVLGNAKGAVAVVVSILIFKNPVSFIGMVGYALTVLGVILYIYMINTRQHQPSDDRKTTINHPMVAAWYGSNIGVLLLNKYLLTNYGFKFPIFLTLRHMAACIVLSYAAIVLMEVVPLQRVKSKVQLAKISGLSVVFCFCVVCGNVSLKYLPVSFNESVGATPPPPSLPPFSHFRSSRRGRLLLTYTALIPVVAGVIIASGLLLQGHSNQCFRKFCFPPKGNISFSFFLCYLLCFEGKPRLDEPAAPIAVTLLLPATLLMEKNVIEITTELALKDVRLIWYLIFDSSLAYFVNLTNFLVTKHTSALTLQEKKKKTHIFQLSM